MTQPDGGTPGTGGAGWSAPGSQPAPQPTPAPQPAPVPGQPAYGVPAPTYAGGPAPAQQHWTTTFTAHKPGIIPLRPLGLGDILEGSFGAMRRNPRTIFGLAFLVSLVVVLGLAAVGALGYVLVITTGSGTVSDEVIAVGAIGGLSLLYLVSAVTGVALTGILSYPVGEAVLGRKPSIGETWRRTRRMVPRLTGLCLVLLVPVLVLFGGLVALIAVAFAHDQGAVGGLGIVAALAAGVGVLFVAIRLALATPALVLEDLGVFASLRRSWALTARRFWRTLGVLLVAAILVGIVQQVFSFAIQLVATILGFLLSTAVDDSATEVVFGIVMVVVVLGGSFLVSLATQPFSAAVGALIYTDERIRKEGFDLALVRAATDAPAGR